ncbi:MAG: 4-hydroxythreonine-4-phosphate dehydrogenase PdxA [bacterium]|nr:4-hydroxythreonine-4-phosphate dehydrogenase PdxA [bacterium]
MSGHQSRAHNALPLVGITMGDAAGIGPEVVVKSLSDARVMASCRCLVYGDREVLLSVIRNLRSSLTPAFVESPDEASRSQSPVTFLHCSRFPMSRVPYGEMRRACPFQRDNALNQPVPLHPGDAQPSQAARETAANAVAYIDEAAADALSSEIDAMVTAPINKAALRQAGLPLEGHTDYLAEKAGVTDYAMMFVGGGLKVVLMTVHIRLTAVAERITQSAVLQKIRLTDRHLKTWFGIEKPRIAVCGLNPHAGEEGMFGDEESKRIVPAIRSAQDDGIAVSGPYPADTVFNRCKAGEFDAVIAMYHDQGLLPVKLLAFDEGVNITIGLPFVRTSPDHGTAYDIAGKGIAHPGSMTAAILLAAEIAARLKATSLKDSS